MKLKGSKIIMECLCEQGVDTIFGYPGGQIMPLYDALYDYTKDGRIRHILTSHEQGATHAADGYARSTGKVGVCFATSGPGATNTVTGIATACMDSSPLVVITGQVPIASIGRDSFQEVDIVGVTLPITKHSFACRSTEELAGVVRRAFQIAKSGRPGPVLIDVPKNLMNEIAEYMPSAPLPLFEPPAVGDAEIQSFARLINEAKQPVLYAGGGVISSEASSELTQLAERAQIPVVTTLMCLGGFDRRHPLSLGMAGMHGERDANMAMQHSDLLICIGARFSDRVTGDASRFAQKTSIIQIDIDRSEVSKNVPADHQIIGDVRDVLLRLLPLIEKNDRPGWNAQVRGWKREIAISENGLNPETVIRTVHELLKDEAIVVTDVGQHQMWTAQKWPFSRPRTMITSGGQGTMGFGMGAAIGARMGNPGRQVVLFTGDGSFRMNCNELMTVAAHELPLLVIVMKNNTLGMVRQWQKLFFDRRYSATDLPDVVDYPKLADAFGLRGWHVSTAADLRKAVTEALATGKGAVIACDIPIDENVWPIVPPGDAINNQVTEEC